MSVKALSVFADNGKITVHSSQCSHVVRDWRKYGTPVVQYAESQMGAIRQLKSAGIRIDSLRIMGCTELPEGFWSRTPSGEPLRLLSTETGAVRATRRLERLVVEEMRTAINDMSPYLREMLGLTRQS